MIPAICALPTATLHCQVPGNVCVRTGTIDLLQTILMLPALVSVWMKCLKARRAVNERECAQMIWGEGCNSPLLKTFEITQNFPLLLHPVTEWWWEWGFLGFITAFRGKCSVNNVSFTPPCYWAQPLCPSPSCPALCLSPALTVQFCCLLLPFWTCHFLAAVSCPILMPMSSSHPLHFPSSLHCVCAIKGSVGCTEWAVFQLSEFTSDAVEESGWHQK